MKEIIAAFKKSMSDLRTKSDAALKKAGPLDQLELGQPVLFALNSMGWMLSSLEEMEKVVEDIEGKLPKEIDSAALALIDSKITAGEFIRKTDHDLAIAAAETKGKTGAEETFKLKEDAVALASTRRGEIATAHGEEVAELIPAETLGSENFATVSAELGRRVTELGKIGLTAAAQKDSFADIACGCAFDEAGNAAFDTRVTNLKKILPGGKVAAAVTTPAPRVVPGSRAPVTAAASQQQETTEDEEKPQYAF